jgi:WD40 repeat protein
MRPLGFCLLVAGLVGPVQSAAPPAASARVDVLGDALPARAVARLGTSRFRLTTNRQTLAVAPDGKTLAVLGPDRDEVVFLDAITGRQLNRFAVAAGDGFAFLPDGSALVCADGGTFTFWGPWQGRALRRIIAKAGGHEVAALSADGRLLAAGSRTSSRKAPLVLYDVHSGQPEATLPQAAAQGSAALSPDGKWLATWVPAPDTPSGRGGRMRGSPREETARPSNQTVLIWAPATGKELCKIDAGSGEGVAAVTFAPDKKTLALATTGGSVQWWDVASGKRLKSWRGAMRTSRECILAFSPDGKSLVLGQRGGDAPLVWDLARDRRLRLPRGPECLFQSVVFPASGRIVAFGMQSQAVVSWDLLTGKRLDKSAGHTAAITALAFRADGRRLWTTAADGSLIEWETSGKEVRRLPAALPRAFGPGPRGFGPGAFPRRPVRTSADGLFSPGGAYLASNDRGAGIWVRDVQTGQDVLTLPSASRSTPAVLAFSRAADRLAVSFAQPRTTGVRLFQMESGEELAAWDTETAAAALAFDPARPRLAVGLSAKESATDSQGEVRVRCTDVDRDDPAFVPFNLPPSTGAVSSLVFSPDGQFLLVVRGRGFAHLLDARTGREVDLVNVNGNLTTAPVFSPDGRSLALASSLDDGTTHTLTLWEMASGGKRWTVGVSTAVTALAFAPSGKLLATGHRDSSALLWEVAAPLARVRPTRPPGGLFQPWACLVGDDGEKAFEAQRTLAAHGDAGVAAIRKRLRPIREAALDDATLARLVGELDAEEFAVRRRAFAALAKEGRSTEPHLRKALEGKPSAEVKRRVRELLARLGRPGASGEQLRGLRAVEVLEWIGTVQARKLVEELSRGRPDAPLTRAATATLRRLAK